MFALLNGKLAQKNLDHVIVDCQGVGYEVFVPQTTWNQLPNEDETAQLFIHTHVTESSLTLFGFYSQQEKLLFKKLISVSGVGPKVAIQILSGISAQDLVQAIINENKSILVTINGIGKKTAERIIIELKDKLNDLNLNNNKLNQATVTQLPTSMNQPQQEVLSALLALGYHKNIAEKALSEIQLPKTASIEDQIKQALNHLSIR